MVALGGGGAVSHERSTSVHSPNPPLSAETVEQFARFVMKLFEDSNIADEGCPGNKKQDLLSSLSPNFSIGQSNPLCILAPQP